MIYLKTASAVATAALAIANNKTPTLDILEWGHFAVSATRRCVFELDKKSKMW